MNHSPAGSPEKRVRGEDSGTASPPRAVLSHSRTNASAVDPGDTALRALAAALLPHLRDLLASERREDELVDVVETVPAPRRAVMQAARQGQIRNAYRVGRRWLAPRSAVEDWLSKASPRAAESDTHHLEELRVSLAREGRR